MEKSRVECVLRKRREGYNCCQSIVCAYCDMVGISELDAFRMTEAFGLGMAGMMETCGAVTALLILAGAKVSDGNLQNPSTKQQSYAMGRALAEKFQEKNTSLICRELKGEKLRSCNGCIADGAQLVEEYLFPGCFEPYRETEK